MKKTKNHKAAKSISYTVKILAVGILIGQYGQPIPLEPRTGFEGSALPAVFDFAENTAHAADYDDTLGGEIDQAIKETMKEK